jgi:hypothetical protein
VEAIHVTFAVHRWKLESFGKDDGALWIAMDSEWRDLFIQKSIHDIREIIYDTRAKATAKRSELGTAVRYFLPKKEKVIDE